MFGQLPERHRLPDMFVQIADYAGYSLLGSGDADVFRSFFAMQPDQIVDQRHTLKKRGHGAERIIFFIGEERLKLLQQGIQGGVSPAECLCQVKTA